MQSLIKRILQACICEELLSYAVKTHGLRIPLKHSGKTILANDVIYFNLNKVQIKGEITLEDQGQLKPLNDVHLLLNLIYEEIADKVDLDLWQRFVQEIDNCAANEFLVNQYSHKFNQNLAAEVTQAQCKSLIEYIATQYSPADQLIFFEGWATQGHPYHPCHKTRLGFNEADYIKYSPEFNGDIQICVAAVEKKLLHIEQEQIGRDYNEWFAQAYPQQWQNFQEKLKVTNLNETHYHPIFIHPWQYENIIITLFSNLIKNKNLIYFDDVNIAMKASLSFRTLIAKDDPKAPHIKLPVAVHSTSTLRIIPPAAVVNGPKLGKMLKAILAHENHFGQHLHVAYESCSLHINDTDPELSQHLAVIYRENPTHFINKNQTLVPVAALYQKSTVTQLPLFIEIIKASGHETLTEATRYFDEYTKICIHAYLDLFLVYGIALEGHQQNTIAVFENFKATHMIQRDLTGLRIHEPTLTRKGYQFTPYPNSRTFTHDAQDARKKLLHTLIQYHLGELGLILAEHFNVSENVFWKIIKNNLESRFQHLKNRVELNRWEEEYNAFLIDDWDFKCLLRMRLSRINQHVYIPQKNPLRDL